MAFISIAADSIGVELDLTPGLKVAGAYYDTLDSDRNGRISEAERVRYRELVARALALSADGAAVPLVITDVRWPTEEQLRDGEGMVRLFAVARLAAPRAGAHVLTFRNDHEPVSSGYMVNPLAPQPPIALVHVTRDYLQHGISVYYTIAPVQPQGNTNGASAIAGFIGAGLTALAAAGVAWRRRVRL